MEFLQTYLPTALFFKNEEDSLPDASTMDVQSEGVHQSVLKEEVLQTLTLQEGEMVLDATAGQGGHSEAILQAENVRLIALDADPAFVAHTKERLAPFGDRAQVVQANFANAKEALERHGISSINKALFDLGWNRGQLLLGRGFSFERDEPLNMSYSPAPRSGFTAANIINTWDEKALADVLFGYGEETRARVIARRIAEARKEKKITTTAELVSLIEQVKPRRGRLNPATQTFQALRIAVNDELGALSQGLEGAWELLAPKGRLAVITFHSIEDRAVKQFFAARVREGAGVLITKKPLTASREELAANRAARSAKLRVIEKIVINHN